MLGLRADQVQSGLDEVASRFQQLGFELHEFTGAESASVILVLEMGVDAPDFLRPKWDRA